MDRITKWRVPTWATRYSAHGNFLIVFEPFEDGARILRSNAGERL